MNTDIQGKLDAIKAPFQSVIEAADALPALIDADRAVAVNEGIEIGKGMIQLPDASNPDAIYTQSQMDAAVSSGKEQQKGEDQVQIDSLTGDVAALKQSLVDSNSALDSVAKKYSDLVERVKAVEADNAQLLSDLQA